VVPPVFYINHLVGKPADNSPGGEPYNEIYQVHLLSPFRVLYNSGFLAVARQNQWYVPIPRSKGTRCFGIRTFGDGHLTGAYGCLSICVISRHRLANTLKCLLRGMIGNNRLDDAQGSARVVEKLIHNPFKSPSDQHYTIIAMAVVILQHWNSTTTQNALLDLVAAALAGRIAHTRPG